MENGTESPLITAQRSAIQQIRGRYERGEITFDTFRDGLDALTQARNPDECATILRDLPHSPLATLAALEPPRLAASAQQLPARPVGPAMPAARKRITAFMSETKKTRNAWVLAPETHVRAMMGAVKLDLRRAQLPAEAYITVRATMSEVIIYVPDDIAVSVRSTAWMSEVKALGESVAGVVASGDETHFPTHAAPRAHLTIEVSALMGAVNIALVNPTAAAIADLARDTLRIALEGMRRGWENGAPGSDLPVASPRPGLPGASAE
ncbi:MAG TPA: LiaF domain-containing protein [Ktedonobacterales bacterium]|nr:LiaF domain-containing protein [Ktedonobacterales bacterium]